MGQGNFSVTFSQEFTPTEIIESIKEWGHIVITPNEIDVNTLSDSDILSTSRYTGIVLNRALEDGVVSINGTGLQLYLGDGNSKGMVIAESKNIGKVRVYTNTTLAESLFNSTVSSGKPFGIMRNESGSTQAITQGTIYEPSTTYIGQHFVQTALGALKEITEYLNVEYRINANSTIDAGPPANLFNGVNTNPSTIVVKTGYGEDPNFDGVVPQGLRTEFDATDWVSRVDFIGEVGYFDSATDVAGEANLSSNPYKDLHGNDLTRVALIQEPEVPTDQLNSRAQLMLTELSRVKKVLNLDLEQYEVSGDMKPGDYIFAFDPDIGFVDTSTDATAESRDLYEVTFRGQVITPVKVRVVGLTFPIANGMGVYFRDKDGNYTDLTQYVQFEGGAAQVELGDVIRFVGDDMRFDEFSLNEKTAGVFSIPDLPSTPTLQSGTYLNATGDSIGFIRVGVSKPTNVDGSQITDGSHYRVRYKKTTDNQYSYVNFPFTGASTESLLIQDLTVGFTYDVGVAVVDKSGFKKMSAYDGTGTDLYTNSSSVNANYATNARIEIEKDGQAPSKPKTATIAAGPLRVQVTHYLGKDGTDGNGNPYGNFTLEGDVDHLDIHAVDQDGNVQDFTVNTANKIGEIRVTSGNLLQAIPVIGTIEVEDSVDKYFRVVAVDKSGNESDPSDGQAAGGNLIAEANITDATITTAKIGDAQITTAKIGDAQITSAKVNDLSADKLTSGSIIGGEIIVGSSSNTSGFIKSQNYSSGSAGWQISPDGTAEFQNATIRGTLNAADITAGTLNVDRLPTITTSQINFDAGDIGGADSSNIVATINTSSEGLQINAAKVNLSGKLNVTNPSITSGNIGGISITGSYIESDNYSTSSGADGFRINSDGTAIFEDVTVRGTISGTVDNDLRFTGSGKITTNTSGNARIEVGSTSPQEIRFLNSSDQTKGQLEIDGDNMILSASSTSSNLSAVAGISGDLILQGGDIDFRDGLTQAPIIKVEGSGGANKYLATNSSGRLTLTGNTSSSGVTSITASGELSLTGAGTGDVTITHADSDHDDRYYTKSTNDLLLAAKAASSHGTHVSYGGDGNSSSVSRSDHTHSSVGSHSHIANDVTGTISITSVSNGGFVNSLSYNNSNKTLTVGGSDTRAAQITTRTHLPQTGNSYNLGGFGQAWATVYRASESTGSDERLKNSIEDIDKGLDFINNLQPRKYKWNNDSVGFFCDVCDVNLEDINDSCDTEDCEGTSIEKFTMEAERDKWQYGFIAQELLTNLDSNTGYGLANYDSEYDNYYYSPTNLVAVLTKAVQELSQQNASLQARIEVLEGG